MKRLKLISGILFFLVFLLLIPKGSCISDKVFLTIGQSAGPYSMQVSRGDKIKWSYQTYDDPFTVSALCTGVAFMNSINTSDSGTVEALVDGGVVFLFMNAGSNSGYIDISIRVQDDSIEGYNQTIFILALISIISIISLKKIRIRKNK